jgi:site-specific DNA recombinase
MKKAIRYLRFSDKKQSNGSIERQELYTGQWVRNNEVDLVDTFIDRGHSAKTFDRPDFKKLQEFISRHHKHVDYLIVDQLDRFSRNAAEAMGYVKKLQQTYSIQIVSVTEGITFDYDTPGSFFRAGLQLLLAEEDNINRSIKVRGGIYTAKAKEGRYIYNKPPFGYFKVGERKERHLEINQKEAEVVRFIFESFLRGVPVYIIAEQAKERGFRRLGNVAVQRILSYPLYVGMQYVQPFKDYPGGLFPAKHDPIIDFATWEQAQRLLKQPEKEKVVVSDELPLRGALKCHCGKFLTGAPSRGKLGKYYYYYKCNKTTHLNLSALKAHDQIHQVFQLMSLPDQAIGVIRQNADRIFENKRKEDKKLLAEKQKELETEDAKLFSVEEKWITNKINQDTYQRWFSSINNSRLVLKAAIERLTGCQDKTYQILKNNLEKLSNLGFIFEKANTLEKQELINLVFERNLYYQDGVYRTPTMMELFTHNSHIMNEKGLLIYKKKRENFSIPPLSGLDGTRTRNIKILYSKTTFYQKRD